MVSNKKEVYFVDTHAHLDMLKNKNPEEAVADADRGDVRYIINVGSSLEGSRMSLAFSRRFSSIFASIGIHPHYVEGFGEKEKHNLELLILGYDKAECNVGDNILKSVKERYKKVVAIGETGFDFYRNLSPKKDQEAAFISQIELAIKYNLPVIIHDREAHNDTLRIVRRYVDNKNFRAVMHCFSGDHDFALECLDLGLYISFTGVITFPNAKKTVDAAKVVPMEKIFIETDAPFLAPQAKRGKENYPEYVKYVAEKIAEIKNLSLEEVAIITSKNAEKFFALDKNTKK